MKGKYDDIIDLPHHVSKKRAPMSRLDRAAQFSPFAALTGYDAVIRETARQAESNGSTESEPDADFLTYLDMIDALQEPPAPSHDENG